MLVDERMRTEDPHILAAGDVAEYAGQIPGLWPVAVAQAEVAADNAVGGDKAYKGSVPFTMLKVVGVELTSVGRFEEQAGDEVVALEEPGAQVPQARDRGRPHRRRDPARLLAGGRRGAHGDHARLPGRARARRLRQGRFDALAQLIGGPLVPAAAGLSGNTRCMPGVLSGMQPKLLLPLTTAALLFGVPAAANAAVTTTIVDPTHVTLTGDAANDNIVTISHVTGANLSHNLAGFNSAIDFDSTAAATCGRRRRRQRHDQLFGGRRAIPSTISGDAGDDILIGGAASTRSTATTTTTASPGFRGDDVPINGGDGNDVMIWNNGDGFDINEGGDGETRR